MSNNLSARPGDGRRGSGPDRPAGHYPWWDPSEELGELAPDVRAVADEIIRSVDSGTRVELDEEWMARCEATLEELWEGIAALHQSLDRCRESAPPGEFAEARQRLDRAAGQLWSLAAGAELRELREFLAEVAHDFRSPLHSSLFLTDALFREERGSLSVAQKRQLSVVHSAVNALLRLSNDLLDFTESDEGVVTPHEVAQIPFSPGQLVSDLVDLLEPITFYRQATLETDVDGEAARIGDPQMLHRVLLNLVSNALEAVEEGETVRLRVGGDDARLRAVIENRALDADVGRMRELLDSGDYPSVLQRLGGQTRGLGLVISGRMVRAADGEVAIERDEDGLTRVSVTVPFPVLEDDG